MIDAMKSTIRCPRAKYFELTGIHSSESVLDIVRVDTIKSIIRYPCPNYLELACALYVCIACRLEAAVCHGGSHELVSGGGGR